MTNKPMLSVKKFIHEVTYEGGEMVEVDKLPELCGSELYVLDSDYQSLHEQLELLRAFLDKPSTHHQGEPVAWQFYQDGKWWNGDDRIKDHRKNTENSGYKTRELYAEQPEPAADHTQCEECKGWGYHENHHEGGGTECGECGGSGKAQVEQFSGDTVVCRRYQLDQHPGQNFYHYDLDPVYGSVPVTVSELITLAESAPVAVVLPDRLKTEPFTTIDRGSKNYKAGYNAAIVEVAKLNGLKT